MWWRQRVFHRSARQRFNQENWGEKEKKERIQLRRMRKQEKEIIIRVDERSQSPAATPRLPNPSSSILLYTHMKPARSNSLANEKLSVKSRAASGFYFYFFPYKYNALLHRSVDDCTASCYPITRTPINTIIGVVINLGKIIAIKSYKS